MQRVLTGVCWLYFAVSIALWIILRQTGDRWWLATVLLFGPYRLWAVPLAPLAGAAILFCRRSIWVVLLSAWMVLFPIMHFCVPWRLAIPDFNNGPRLRVLTCNLQRQKADALVSFIEVAKPDVVAIQEWSSQQNSEAFSHGGWHCVTNDELFLASRYPIAKMDDAGVHDLQGMGIAVRYDLEMPWGFVHFINLRLASPHQSLEYVRWRAPSAPDKIRANSQLRLTQSQLISTYGGNLGPSTLLAGDFNTPEGSGIHRECWSHFSNAFSTAGFGFGLTYHTKLISTRIDHILSTTAWRCRDAWVGPNVGSSHRPVIADFDVPRDH